MFRTGDRAALSSRSPNAQASLAAEVSKHSLKIPGNYPFRLNFYDRPPVEEITVDEFETYGIDRLRVLADIESSFNRNKTPEELAKQVHTRLKNYLPLASNTAKGTDFAAERRKDNVSHFVLRLAFCRSEELRMRFIKAEAELFKVRFESDDAEERAHFLKSLNFDWKPVPIEEKNALRDQLSKAMSFSKNFNIDNENFLKVHWTRVPDLVSQRKVLLINGQAYVPVREQLSLVMHEFKSRLSAALELTSRSLPRLEEDERLIPVLEHLSMGFMAGVTSEYTYDENAPHDLITADMVEELIRRHAPLCMRNLQDDLKAKKHLRHNGRLQYTLFLKGIGLPLEEAMVFWRRSFSKFTDDQFNKEYAYNVKHSYGRVGGMKNYKPKDCQMILTQNTPGANDSHGCPFRHFSRPNLDSALSSVCGVSDSSYRNEILALADEKHYHVACTRVFELTHNVKKGEGLGNGESVSHPNRYFDHSRHLEKVAKGEVDNDSMQVD